MNSVPFAVTSSAGLTARSFHDSMSGDERKASQRRRVLMTVDAVGGVWRYAMELAAALRPLGIEVIFVGLGPRPTAEQSAEAERMGRLMWLEEPLDWMTTDQAALDRLPTLLTRLVDKYQVELLHLNLPSQACGLDVPVPVVVVSHSCVVTWWKVMKTSALPPEWQWQRERNSAGFKRADAIVAPSASHADLLDRCYGPLPGLSVVCNGIAAFLHGEAKEPFVFAAARWWDEGKNAAVLDAAAETASWPIYMAGPRRSPAGHEVCLDHVTALDELPYEQVLNLTRRAGIFVSPSLYEPFGLAALEAARAGAALVLADIPTYRELWSGAAEFFDPHDAGQLGRKINEMAADAELRADLGSRALARSRRFTPDVQARSMAELYGSLIETPTSFLVEA